jgi:hypothetical protein
MALLIDAALDDTLAHLKRIEAAKASWVQRGAQGRPSRSEHCLRRSFGRGTANSRVPKAFSE